MSFFQREVAANQFFIPSPISHLDTSYMSYQDTSNTLYNSYKGLIFGHLNICSLSNKCLSLYHYLIYYNISILSLNETWLSTSITNGSLYLPGYKIVRADRPTRGGGIAFLVCNKINCIVENIIMSESLELLHISIEIKSCKPISFISVYRPPKCSSITSLLLLRNFLNNIQYTTLPLILLGDLNIDISCKNTAHTQLSELVHDYAFIFTHHKYTRITSHSKTCIDLVISNSQSKNYINDVESIITGLSDHNLLLFKYKKGKLCKTPHTVTKCRVITTNKLHDFNIHINEFVVDVNHIMKDCTSLDVQFSNIMTNINSSIDLHFPLLEKRQKNRSHPWINLPFKKLCHKRDKMFHLARKCNSPCILMLAKTLRNECTCLSRKLKRDYFRVSICDNSNNPKKLWSILKPLYKDDLKAQYTAIILMDTVNNILISENSTPKYINEYFLNTVDSLHHLFDQSIPFTTHTLLTSIGGDTYPFSFIYILPSDILKIIVKLKKSSRSLASIKIPILHYCSTAFADLFANVINRMFDRCCFPSEWKLAEVIPIHKSGSKRDAHNYRPISILPNISKIAERVMHTQIIQYLNNYSLLPDCQHGFRPTHSTETAVISFNNCIQRMLDQKLFILVVFIDFSKAFDVLSHDILLQKLKALNFSIPAIEMLRSYLCNRKQHVYCNGVHSPILNVCHGVPQGSILGPLLFTIYIYDMVKYIKDATIIQYADDTTLIVGSSNISDVFHRMNDCLTKMTEYCYNNKIVINPKKTKCMIFTNKHNTENVIHSNNLSLLLNGCLIDECVIFKFLGVLITPKLNFKAHGEHIVKKLNSIGSLLVRCRHFLPIDTRLLLFNAIGRCHINYCSSAYFPTCTISTLKQIESRYVDCGRIIILNKFGISKSQTLNALGWLTIRQCLLYNFIIFVSKIVINKTPHILYSMLHRPLHTYSTRTLSHDFILPQIASNIGRNSFSFMAPKVWNMLPYNIKTANSLNAVKMQVHPDLLDTILHCIA